MTKLEQLEVELKAELKIEALDAAKVIASKIPLMLEAAAEQTETKIDDTVALLVGEPLKKIALDAIAKVEAK